MTLTRGEMVRLCRARDELRGGETPLRTIAAIARDAGISPFHFIRRFHAVFGVTPHQDRLDARFDRARQLLARGTPVTDVCFDVGCESLGSFSQFFSRRTGEAPSTFQRRIRVQVSVPGALPPSLIPGCFTLMGHLPADAFRSFRQA